MMDISNFYLMAPFTRPKYLLTKLIDISDEIITEYNLMEKATKDGSVYIMVIRGMYGLPHAGLLANELLEKRLNKHGLPTEQIGSRCLEARLALRPVHTHS